MSSRIVTLLIVWYGLYPLGQSTIAAANPLQTITEPTSEPLPKLAIARLGNTLFSHTAPIRTVEISADGNYLFTRDTDNTAILWEVASGRRLKTWSLESSSRIATLSPSGKQIALQLDAKVLTVLDWANDEKSTIPISEEPALTRFLWSPSGQSFTTIDAEGKGQIYDSPFRKPRISKIANLKTAGFTLDSQFLLWANNKAYFTVQKIDRDDSFNVDISAFPSAIIDFFPVLEGIIATVHEDQTIQLWDLRTRKHVGSIKGSAPYARAAKSNQFVTIHEGWVSLHDQSKRGEPVRITKAEGANGLALSPEGDRLFIAGPGNRLRVWNVLTGKELYVATAHQTAITGLVLDNSGKKLLSTSAEGLRVWNLDRQQEEAEARHGDAVFSLTLTGDGSRLVTGGKRAIRIWSPIAIPGGKLIPDRAAFTVDSSVERLTALASSSDGEWVAYAEGKTVEFLDSKLGTKKGSIELTSDVISLAISPKARQLATVTRGGLLQVWSLEKSPVELWKKRIQRSAKATVAYSPNGLLVAVASVGKIVLLESLTGKQWQAFDRQLGDGELRCITFSPDGNLVAAGHAGPDGLLRLWEVMTGSEVATFSGQHGDITALQFTPNGRKLLSGSSDSTIVLWDGLFPNTTTKADLEPKAAWELLDEQDTKLAYQAMGSLIRGGPKSISQLRKGVLESADRQRQRITWIRQLDHDEYKVRQAARTALEKDGLRALPAVQLALTQKPGIEGERLLTGILETYDRRGLHAPAEGLFGEPLRLVRTVRILEEIGGTEALQILESLAQSEGNGPEKSAAIAAIARGKK